MKKVIFEFEFSQVKLKPMTAWNNNQSFTYHGSERHSQYNGDGIVMEEEMNQSSDKGRQQAGVNAF